MAGLMLTAKGQKPKNKDDAALTPMLTVGQASHLFSIHGNTLRLWNSEGLIIAYRVGPRGDRRFKREDVDALLVEARYS